MFDHRMERMKSIVEQAIAEAHGAPLRTVHLISYGDISDEAVAGMFAEASSGTPAEGVAVEVQAAGTRFICWNCCGLRFAGYEGVCPNCGEEGLTIPDDISFALDRVEAGEGAF